MKNNIASDFLVNIFKKFYIYNILMFLLKVNSFNIKLIKMYYLIYVE